MKNRTENHDNPDQPNGCVATAIRTQCTERSWCDVSAGHVDEHSCEADLPKITATGYREDFTGLEDGIGVPEVFARLVEHEHSNTFDPFVVQLCIVKPGSSGEVGESATGWLTLHEAGLLAKALTELQGVARSAR
jgi:hypothetical protein